MRASISYRGVNKKRFSGSSLRAALAVFLFLLSGCATFSKSRESNLYQVRVGGTKAQLIETMGEPKSQAEIGGAEKWYYDVYSNDSSRIYPYTATFENGILTQWYFDTARGTSGGGPRQAGGRSGLGGVGHLMDN